MTATNERFTVRIDDRSENESRSLLEELSAHSTQTDFIYTHRWQAHDLAMWDDATVIHSATSYNSACVRHMHRIDIADPKIG